jgi:membrane-associated progesterone receptor component
MAPIAAAWWMRPLLVAVIGIIGSSQLLQKNRDTIDVFFMGVFRDIGRIKALKRRNQGKNGLAILFKQDNPLLDLTQAAALDADDDKKANIPAYTKSELTEFGSGLAGMPILIALFGRVYDVTAGHKFYGPTAPYGIFAGHDVTYALSTGCFRDEDCVDEERHSIKDLSDKQLAEGQRWLSFFHLHDKYPMVGRLEDGDYVETLLRELIEQAEEDAAKQGGDKPLAPPFKPQQN